MYLYVPEGKTVTCTGANASGLTGGGAGIELTEGNTLYLIGGGTVLTDNGDGTWTIASMPAFDVELQIEYETALALSETADSEELREWWEIESIKDRA